MTALKVIEFSGLQRIAPANIESHATESALKDAQFTFDLMIHDLRSEMIQREAKIRQEFIDRVNAIMAAAE